MRFLVQWGRMMSFFLFRIRVIRNKKLIIIHCEKMMRARFFYSEILKCTTMTELDLSRVRGDRLVLIGIEKTPAASEFDEITKAIAQKSEWRGRFGRVRRFDSANGEIGPLPSLLPLMLHWNGSDMDASLGVSESCGCSTMEDYHRAIDAVEFSWCSALCSNSKAIPRLCLLIRRF